MAGSGTSADPYIVETWADFKTYVNQRGKYVVFASDIEPTGSDTEGVVITWAAESVDGDGHTIRNFRGYFTGGVSNDTFDEVKNLNFTNLDNRYNYLFTNGSTTGGKYVDIVNCKFEGYTRAVNLFYYGSVYFYCPRISRCSFNFRVGNGNFRLVLPYTSSSYSAQAQNCNIKLKYEGVVADGTRDLINCQSRNMLINIEDGNNGTILLNQIGDSIIIGNNVSIANDSTSNMAGAICYDSDNITVSGTLASSRFKAMTNSEMKSISALQAVGFPIE